MQSEVLEKKRRMSKSEQNNCISVKQPSILSVSFVSVEREDHSHDVSNKLKRHQLNKLKAFHRRDNQNNNQQPQQQQQFNKK